MRTHRQISLILTPCHLSTILFCFFSLIPNLKVHHLTDGNDFLWSTTDVAIWSTVEPGIGIAAASIATLRPLWQLICYRTGLSNEAPANLRWRERNRGRRTYIRSDGSSSKRKPRLRPDIDTSLTNITIEASDTLSPKDHFSSRLSAASSHTGITKTTEFVAFGATRPLPPLPVEVRLFIFKVLLDIVKT